MAKGQRKSNKEIRKPKKVTDSKPGGLAPLPKNSVQGALRKDQ